MATKLQKAAKKSEKSAICSDIELKFGIGTNVWPLSSKTIRNDVIVTPYIKI